MNLYQLVYKSKMPKLLTCKGVEQLIEKAKAKNINNDVTGVLIRHNEFLIQILEGNRQTIHELFEVIASDPRHSQVQMCYFEPVEQRLFGKWAMSFLNLNHSRFSTYEDLKQKTLDLVEAEEDKLTQESLQLLSNLDEQMKK